MNRIALAALLACVSHGTLLLAHADYDDAAVRGQAVDAAREGGLDSLAALPNADAPQISTAPASEAGDDTMTDDTGKPIGDTDLGLRRYEGRYLRSERRKIFAEGRLVRVDDGTVTAEADAIVISFD